MAEETGGDKRMPRRGFLIETGKWLRGALALPLAGSELVKPVEVPKMLVVDIFNLRIPEIGSGMATKVAENYAGHGKAVQDIRSETAKRVNPIKAAQEIVVTEPLNPAIKIREIEPDRLGNPRAVTEVSQEEVEKIIDKSDAEIVIMSFELGTSEVTLRKNVERKKYSEMGRQLPQERNGKYFDYSGNPISKEEFDDLRVKSEELVTINLDEKDWDLLIVDGYAGGNTLTNFTLLCEMASKFSEKTFIAAGGNPSSDAEGGRIPDLRKAREAIQRSGEKLVNLIIVGVEYDRQGSVFPGGLGADVYVNEKDLAALNAKKPASSFATPVVAELVLQFGKDKVMNEMTETKMWWGSSGNEQMEYKVVKIPNVTREEN